ncbi:ABC transporter ATP-binding protein [Metallosphaera tengchongensis]|uniref:ABC transporter ATP-binding protein n=1 Tax=Metallosphaera tengchongensis TaxID=1532350 RepID=A0A6N0NVR6_9CREN|nr:ABC transporter ATP-binding protein [Metallosphaera tengchongensis]QKR00317.1 ABC transporter ATP-binding protein [Metallosphaera tengchongensis]
MKTIDVINVTKTYGEKLALNDVSMSVTGGEITAILGPNGAGKTTLLRIVTTLIYPDRGEIRIMGQDPFKSKEVFKKVGYVQELPNLPPFMTGRELLEFSAKLKGANREEIHRVLDLVDMKENANKKIAKYSKGMIQRIALAEAFLGDPEILIMDEPNVGTDPVLNLKVREVLMEMRRGGVTVLMTSHELEEVKRLADKVFFIYRGKVFFEGTTEELVMRFLGVRVILETRDRESLISALKGLEYVKGLEESNGKFVIELQKDEREELLRELVLRGVRIKAFYLDQDLEEAYERAIREAGAR